MKIVAFVPIKYHSERLPNKNFLLIGNQPIYKYIFNTLLELSEIIDEIYVYCSNPEIMEELPSNIKFLKRDIQLDSNQTLGIELYTDFCQRIDSDIYILAHATSPFLSSNSILDSLNLVLSENTNYDSALSVKKIQNFVWYKNKPLNYNLQHIPRTQTIEPIFVETSGFYIFQKKHLLHDKKRIGEHPFLMELNSTESIDIDNLEDYLLATTIYKQNNDLVLE